MEKSNLRVVFASDSNYMKSVENAIRVGGALLLCDVEESLDPELRPVLQRELSHRSVCLSFLDIDSDLLLYSRYYAEACKAFLGHISASSPQRALPLLLRKCRIGSEPLATLCPI